MPGDPHLLGGVIAPGDTVRAVDGVPGLALAAQPGALTEQGLDPVGRGQSLPELLQWLAADVFHRHRVIGGGLG